MRPERLDTSRWSVRRLRRLGPGRFVAGLCQTPLRCALRRARAVFWHVGDGMAGSARPMELCWRKSFDFASWLRNACGRWNTPPARAAGQGVRVERALPAASCRCSPRNPCAHMPVLAYSYFILAAARYAVGSMPSDGTTGQHVSCAEAAQCQCRRAGVVVRRATQYVSR